MAVAGSPEPGDGPERKSYAITGDGATEVTTWLETPSAPEPHLQTVLFAKVVLSLMLDGPGRRAGPECARNRLPDYDPPATLGEQHAERIQQDLAYQQLADVVVLTSLAIAGSTLAASVAAAQAGPFKASGGAYYVITGAGIAVSLGIIASTMPLLRALPALELARNE